MLDMVVTGISSKYPQVIVTQAIPSLFTRETIFGYSIVLFVDGMLMIETMDH